MPERGPRTVVNRPQGIEKKGGYPAGDKPVSELKPPPESITQKSTESR